MPGLGDEGQTTVWVLAGMWRKTSIPGYSYRPWSNYVLVDISHERY